MTGRWVIIAPDRARRPLKYCLHEIKEPEVGVCCFCPGNEHLTPREVLSFGEGPPDSPGWRVRVFPNMFPAVTEGAAHDTFRPEGTMPALGLHEVVVESPEHSVHPALMRVEALEEVLLAYRERFRAGSAREGVRYVQIFKNQGYMAGASIDHPHSQILGLPIIPGAVADELRLSERYMRQEGRSLYADALDGEKERSLVVKKGRFQALIPYASRFPYEIYLLHDLDTQFRNIDEAQIHELAHVLRATLRAIHDHLDDPSYNLYLHAQPCDTLNHDHYRWHFHIVPRLVGLGGFELGTDMGINPCFPEDCARSLREALR